MLAFLARNPAFAAVPLGRVWAEVAPDRPAPCEGEAMLLSPAAQGTDGFFCAIAERRA
jgi:16S rRNA (cytosine967-C5)-methyltransferase